MLRPIQPVGPHTAATERSEATKRPDHAIDWTAVEHEYRLGVRSLREMACKFGCSHSTIANRASRLGWRRSRLHERHK